MDPIYIIEGSKHGTNYHYLFGSFVSNMAGVFKPYVLHSGIDSIALKLI